MFRTTASFGALTLLVGLLVFEVCRKDSVINFLGAIFFLDLTSFRFMCCIQTFLVAGFLFSVGNGDSSNGGLHTHDSHPLLL